MDKTAIKNFSIWARKKAIADVSNKAAYFGITAKEIKGAITKVNEAEKTLLVDITMNEVTKEVPMTYEIVEGNIVAKGAIEILDYNLKGSFLAFAKECAALHENKSFSEVDIEFSIPFK